MPSRRALLSGIAGASLVGVSGCLGGDGDDDESPTRTSPWSPSASLDSLRISNGHDEAHTLSLVVTRDGETVLDEQFDVPAQSSVENPPQLPREDGTYHVEASLESGETATYEWNQTSNSQYVRVSVTREGELRIAGKRHTV